MKNQLINSGTLENLECPFQKPRALLTLFLKLNYPNRNFKELIKNGELKIINFDQQIKHLTRALNLKIDNLKAQNSKL